MDWTSVLSGIAKYEPRARDVSKFTGELGPAFAMLQLTQHQQYWCEFVDSCIPMPCYATLM